MECYKIENLNFRYPTGTSNVLSDISFSVDHGEFIVLCGKSGCGKTTLLRLMKSVLAPSGEKSGQIYFDGIRLSEVNAELQASKIGFVLQDVENQLVTDKVWHELAFGLESLGVPTPQIKTRVSEMAEFFGITDWFYKNVADLSGGEKQILNLASVMVMRPEVLILDEPTSQLDPIAASEFLKTVARINRELGTTVILSEHRLEDVLEIADRMVVMDDGRIIADDTPIKVGRKLKELNHNMVSALPTPMRVADVLSVREGRIWLEEFRKTNTVDADRIPKSETIKTQNVCIELKNVWFRYEKNEPDVIKGLSFKVNKGEMYAIVGGNGTGKTTTLSLISGINKAYRGKVTVDGRVSALPQNPQMLFTQKTVKGELLEMKIPQSETEQIVAFCELERLLERHPYDLSGGEAQRAALAKVLLAKPDILLLDEPTKGLDAHFKEKLADILLQLTKSGVTVIMVSHDIEFCAKYANRCSMFFDGAITATATPRELFSGNTFYTTSANRMAKNVLPEAILAEDIILACGGTEEKKKTDVRLIEIPQARKNVKTPPERSKRKITKRSIASLLAVLFAIPLTIYAGIHHLGDRKYYFISLLIIFEILVPFSMSFESRKPQARELVIISVLCAIAVGSRLAFYMLPQVKPVIAIVIISGICFGGEAGFLIGAVTAFVSNFFFGQGPWTPWQMVSFGAVGFLAGILFSKGLIRKNRTSLCIFGFLATVIIYGFIANTGSVIMMQATLTKKALFASLAAGLPFDVIHGVSVAFFLWFIAEPMIDKLLRIRTKYGLMK